MPRDPRVDAAIATAAPFARPILDRLRAAMHEAVPDIGETIKWGRPFFTIAGRPFAFMAAFKAHVAFGFWKGRAAGSEEEADGRHGRLTTPDDLPAPAELVALIRAAAAAPAASAQAAAKSPKPAIAMPEDFAAALAGSAAAHAGFDALPPGARREYLEWIVAAKRPETRAARIARATVQLAEGKRLNWKYESC